MIQQSKKLLKFYQKLETHLHLGPQGPQASSYTAIVMEMVVVVVVEVVEVIVEAIYKN
jgi:hypothetical protein